MCLKADSRRPGHAKRPPAATKAHGGPAPYPGLSVLQGQSTQNLIPAGSGVSAGLVPEWMALR